MRGSLRSCVTRLPMFLFSNAPVGTRDTGSTGGGRATAAGSGTVVDAIRQGAASSGVGFDYLLATAQRESSLDPSAKAATSSATGLYQFIEQTWLGVMKNAGPKLGLSNYADAITAGSDGSYSVADPSARQAILDLRRDPRVSAAMAGALTQKNREALTSALGREPTSGDLYAAHVLGAKGATILIASAQSTPARAAAIDLPNAASANRNLFYDKTGRARSSSELYAVLATSTAGGKPAVAAASSLPAASVPEMTTSYASLEDGLRNLFQTDKRQGAVSAGVARLWQNRQGVGQTAGQGTSQIGAAPALSYFPRSDSSQETEALASTPTAEAAPTPSRASIVVPLPPQRPAEFTTTLAAITPSLASAAPRARQAAIPAVLPDLSSYTLRNGP